MNTIRAIILTWMVLYALRISIIIRHGKKWQTQKEFISMRQLMADYGE